MTHEGKILMVEDQREWQVELKEILLDRPYKIEFANTFQKASDLLEHHGYDLVLLDLRLKDWEEGNFEGMRLLDTLVKCRQQSGTQVIIVSAYGEKGHVRDGFKKYNIADYFDKRQLNPIEFKKAVDEAINKAFEERGEILDNM